jgi:hypothetical protein
MHHVDSFKSVASGVLLALGLLLSSEAAAQDGFLNPPSDKAYFNIGPLLSATGRPSGTTYGLGGEMSLHYFPPQSKGQGAGVFAQLQATNQEHLRLAGGVQFNFLAFGLELGLAYEDANDDFASTTSLHLAPFISGGVVTLGLRLGIPLSSNEPLPNHGSDIGVTLTVKLPVALGGLSPRR